jgi:topoisomerase-4 subunit A
VTTFKGSDGLNWVGDGGRVSNLSLKELAAWRGNRGDAGPGAAGSLPRQSEIRPAGLRTARARTARTAAARGK